MTEARSDDAAGAQERRGERVTISTQPQFDSVITEEMRAKIGLEAAPLTYEVTSTSVRMFARAVGYADPVFYDRAVAQSQGYRDLPAPPGYLGTPVFDPERSDPVSSGRRDAGARVPSPHQFVLNGGTDLEFFDAGLCAGDVLTAVSKLESLAERYSTALGSPILIQTISTTYTNQEGRLVAIGRGTTISYGRRPEDAE